MSDIEIKLRQIALAAARVLELSPDGPRVGAVLILVQEHPQQGIIIKMSTVGLSCDVVPAVLAEVAQNALQGPESSERLPDRRD